MMSSATKSLADELRSQFSSITQKKGRQYFSGSKVRFDSVEDWHIATKVSGGELYDVDLWIELSNSNDLVANCTCPFFNSNGPCKHVFASLLAIDCLRLFESSEREIDFWLVPAFDLDAEEMDRLENPDLSSLAMRGSSEVIGRFRSEALEEVEAAVESGRTFGGQAALPRKVSTPAWQSQLQKIRELGQRVGVPPPRDLTRGGEREIWFALNVSETLRTGCVRIDYLQRERKQNGEFGKLKKYSLREYDLPQTTGDAVESLLAALTRQNTDNHQFGYRAAESGCGLQPALHDALLPKLCNSGRLFWALDSLSVVEPPTSTLAWDNGPPWRLRVNVVEDRKAQAWRLTGELFRTETGEAVSATNAPVCLTQSGVILFPDRLARLEAHDEFPWIVHFRKQAEIVVPFTDREAFLGLLWTQSNLPQLELPKELRAERVVGEPRGRIVFAEASDRYVRSDRYQASVFFRYSDEPLMEFSLKSNEGGLFDAAAKRVVSRDWQKEAEWLVTLRGLPLTAPYDYGRKLQHNYELWKSELPRVVPTLLDKNWIVESDGSLFRQPGELRLEVESQVDWFELTGGVDFGGETVSFPKLLKALHDNQRFITLEDGSQGLVPSDLLQKFLSLTSLAESSGNMIRFKKSQGLLLDALLASQKNVTFDKQFDQFRTKVRSFSGVDAAEPTKTFTGTLRDYQKEGLGWLHFLRDFGLGGCLADDMGLGKTVQVLALLEARRLRRLKKEEVRRPSLVIVPKSLIFNWIDEAARFTPKLRIHNFTGVERELPEPSEYDVLLTTYATMRIEILQLSKQRFDYAILDEATAIKNGTALAAKASRLIVANHRLAMTGTPVENHLGELWSLFEFLNPGMLGASAAFQAFSRKSSSENGSIEMLAHALRPYLLRRTKEQVLTELPEKMEQTIHCELSPKERKRYDELRDYYRGLLSGTIKTRGLAKSKIHVLEALLRLRQAACHQGLLDMNRQKETSAKLEVMFEQLEEVLAEGHKALIFSQFTSLLSIVQKHLRKRNWKYEYLDGKTTHRAEVVDRFQSDPDCQLFLISLKAGGQGLNLTAADYVFILDPWWNPAVEAQAIDRAHRLGQTKRVFAYRLIAKDTVEDKILELQKSKQSLADAIISADNSLIRNLTADDLELLLS